ncbi:small peptidoglycan-associated lipoprotein [Robertmurraya massiliosenegalensis]|uniref:small peptidoglycan-associated lipoprotein n=1 Tax=Robertmurraya TaxID=2837507 RepID=UPI0039A6156C
MKMMPILIVLILITSACQNNDNSFEIDSNIKQIIFFSHEKEYANLHIEAPYYDVIIELRQQFPDEFKEMKTFAPTKEKDIFERFEIGECPAILVIHHDEILAKVAGEISKEEILQPIEAALTN